MSTINQLYLPGQHAPRDRACSQWFTPSDLSRQIIAWSGVRPGMRVLEPSAGDGSLVSPLLDVPCLVTAVEADRALISSLVGLRARRHFELRNFDFLQLADLGAFDVAVMNPPYEDGQDLAHVLHAIEYAPRVVALLRLVFLSGQERGSSLWAKHTLRRLAVLSSRPLFRGDGNSGAKSDFAVFDIARGRSNQGTVEMEWW